VKISPPSNFTGARVSNVETWIFEMDQYLTVCGVNDERRVAVASSYLKESALLWWRTQAATVHTWAVFRSALVTRFQPLAASRTARTQIQVLQQGSMSVSEYCSKFQNLVLIAADMGEPEQLHRFIFGLRPNLAQHVELREPATVHEAMTLATKIELLLRNQRSHDRHAYSSSEYSTSTNSTSAPPATSTSTSSAMELGNLNSRETEENLKPVEEDVFQQEYQRYLEEGDEYEPNYEFWKVQDPAEQEEEGSRENLEQLQAMQQRLRKPGTGPRAPYLPPNEYERCMRNGLCLKCKQPGHIHRNCPNTPSSQPQNRRPTSRPYVGSQSRPFQRNFH
jgi:hypothetical protein